MNVIAFVNQKGGVGKTTLALHMGAMLSSKGYSTLIIDNDSQCNISNTFLKETPNKTMFDVMTNGILLKDIIQKTELNNLDIAPNTVNSVDTNILISRKDCRELILKNSIKESNLSYDYILIDCNGALDLCMINALACANNAIIPIDCSAYSLTGLSNLTSYINQVKSLNKDLTVKGFVLNNVDRRSNLSVTLREAINGAFPSKLLKQDISMSSIFAKMQYNKETILNHKNTKSYKEIKELTAEVFNVN